MNDEMKFFALIATVMVLIGIIFYVFLGYVVWNALDIAREFLLK